jgi:hypothetical protein
VDTYRQPNKTTKDIIASHGATQTPQRMSPESQKKMMQNINRALGFRRLWCLKLPIGLVASMLPVPAVQPQWWGDLEYTDPKMLCYALLCVPFCLNFFKADAMHVDTIFH